MIPFHMETDEIKLHLSDSFENTCAAEEFEWTATVKNINYGHIAIYNWLKNTGREEEAEAIMKPENESLRKKIQQEYVTLTNV